MKLSSVFAYAALVPAIIGGLLLSVKGCGQAVLFTDDHQDRMSIVEKTTDNIFKDVESIIRVIGGNVAKTPEYEKLKETVDDVMGEEEKPQKTFDFDKLDFDE